MKKILSTFIATVLMFSASAEVKKLIDVANLKNSEVDFSDFSEGLYRTMNMKITLDPSEWYVDYKKKVSLEALNNTDIKSVQGKNGTYIDVKTYPGKKKNTVILTPSYDTIFAEANQGFGHISNVGSIKSISMRVDGLGYDDDIYLFLKRSNSKIEKRQLGNLKKDGLFTFTDKSKDYAKNPKNKKVEIKPVYPFAESDLYLDHIEVKFNQKSTSGYNIIHIGDIIVEYDLARPERDFEVDNEADWGINKEIKNSFMEKEAIKIVERKRELEDARLIMAKEKLESKNF